MFRNAGSYKTLAFIKCMRNPGVFFFWSNSTIIGCIGPLTWACIMCGKTLEKYVNPLGRTAIGCRVGTIAGFVWLSLAIALAPVQVSADPSNTAALTGSVTASAVTDPSLRPPAVMPAYNCGPWIDVDLYGTIFRLRRAWIVTLDPIAGNISEPADDKVCLSAPLKADRFSLRIQASVDAEDSLWPDKIWVAPVPMSAAGLALQRRQVRNFYLYSSKDQSREIDLSALRRNDYGWLEYPFPESYERQHPQGKPYSATYFSTDPETVDPLTGFQLAVQCTAGVSSLVRVCSTPSRQPALGIIITYSFNDRSIPMSHWLNMDLKIKQLIRSVIVQVSNSSSSAGSP